MKEFDTGNDKIKIICNSLIKETIEPAQNQAKLIIEDAQQNAEDIIKDAQHQVQKIHENSNLDLERQKAMFSASLKQAYRQSIEEIREKIEKNLFQPVLQNLIQKELKNDKVIAQMIQAVIKSIEKEGIYSDLSVAISSDVKAENICQYLTAEVMQKLKEKPISLTSLGGGIRVKIEKDNMILDLSDEALEELMLNYMRKDLRNYIFKT